MSLGWTRWATCELVPATTGSTTSTPTSHPIPTAMSAGIGRNADDHGDSPQVGCATATSFGTVARQPTEKASLGKLLPRFGTGFTNANATRAHLDIGTQAIGTASGCENHGHLIGPCCLERRYSRSGEGDHATYARAVLATPPLTTDEVSFWRSALRFISSLRAIEEITPAELERLLRLLLDLRYAPDQQGGDVIENLNNGETSFPGSSSPVSTFSTSRPLMIHLRRIVSASGPPRTMVWRTTSVIRR
jgi:hypothetical protein